MTPSQRQAAIEKIRAACIAANRERWNNPDNYESHMSGWTIRLADVLLAIETKSSSYSVSNVGYFERWECLPDTNGRDYRLYSDPKIRWNLRADDLTQQSDELIELVANLV